jgi:cytochrome c-type biogenesis protein CcmH/NrfG
MFRLALLLVLTICATATAQHPEPAQNQNSLLQKADELYNARRYDEAQAELRRVIENEPTNAEAFWLLGRIHQQLHEQEDAIGAFQTAIFWEPHLIDTHISLVRIFLVQNKRSEAKKYIKLALAIDPANQEALVLRKLLR